MLNFLSGLPVMCSAKAVVDNCGVKTTVGSFEATSGDRGISSSSSQWLAGSRAVGREGRLVTNI